MNKVKQQMKKAKRAGLTPLDLLRIKETAKKAADKAEKQATDKAFLYMLAIPLNVLVNDYWSKSAKKRAPKFIDDVPSLYEAVQDGVVTDEQLRELLRDMAGLEVE